jgi:DNA-binding beta-propeller fold protein YncE
VIRVWTGQGGIGQLSNPQGLTLDVSGDVLVADTVNRVVRRFSPAGIELNDLGIPDAFRLSSPAGLAVQRGVLYVADSQHNRIEMIDAGRDTATRTLAGIDVLNPTDVALDRSGTMYIADTGNSTIRVLGPGGKVAAWTDRGGTGGPLLHPEGVALDNGAIAVADTGRSRIVLLSRRGRQLGVWGPGLGLDRPAGIAADARGHLYIADTGNNRIVELSSTGRLLHRWGSKGSGRGQFLEPTGIAVDAQGRVVVADAGNDRVQEIIPAG